MTKVNDFVRVCNMVRYVFVRTDSRSRLAFRPPNAIGYDAKGL